MPKIIKIKESELRNLINQVISEQLVEKPLKVGDRGDKVMELQNRLKSIGANLGKGGPNKDGVDGRFGNLTKKALESIQGRFKIPLTGTYDQQTKNLLGQFNSPILSNLFKYNKPSSTTPQKTQTKQPERVIIDKKYVPCVRMSPKKTAVPIKGSKEYAVKIDGHIFYSNGRVMTADNKMGNYYCFDNGVKIQTQEKVYYLETGVKTEKQETSTFSGGVKGFLRRKFPNIAQMFFTRELTNKDFDGGQKKIIYDVIQKAINRDPKKNTKQKGSTEYIDYSPDIASKLEGTGASTMDMVVGTAMDQPFKIATTLGRFSYSLQSNGNYLVTDKYDFSKAKAYTVAPEEVKDMTFPEKYAYISKKTGLNPYRTFRHIAYLEHPDSAPEATKTPITLDINPAEYI
jgi:peptidoglycan hydrolase-like protein with peptidoglycan-binding domain